MTTGAAAQTPACARSPCAACSRCARAACADRDEWRVVVDAAEARFPIEPFVDAACGRHREHARRARARCRRVLKGVDALLADAQALRAAVLSAAGGDGAVELYYEVAEGDVLHAEVVPRADGAPGEARLMADWTLRTRGLARATGAGASSRYPGC